MVKAKVGGIVLGGLAAYLILSKGLNVVNNCVPNMCVAHERKNYYKYGKEGNMVPPGYQMHTHTTENGDNVQVGTPEAIKQEEAKQNGSASQKPLGATIGEAIVKVINEVFSTDKKAEEASENDICPECCTDCKVEKCPYEDLKQGGIITEWRDHKPVAGKYTYEGSEEPRVDCDEDKNNKTEEVDNIVDIGINQSTDAEE